MTAVHESFHDLKIDPFGLSPDPRLSFGHSGYRRAKAYLQYALRRGEGFTVVTGAAGTGKTTLANEVLAGSDNARIHLISPPGARLSPRDLRQLVATSLGVSGRQSQKAALLLAIREALIQRQRKWQQVLLLVDEAHGLSTRALEELRLLSDMQHNGRLLLQVVLVGQEPLLELVRAPAMEHLRQRIIAAAHLQPLSVEETVAYIAHRLQRAGWKRGTAMTSGAVEAIHDFSGGVPRRVNLICSRLLVLGAVEDRRRLERSDVETVVAAVREEMGFGFSGTGPQAAVQRDPGETGPADSQPGAAAEPSALWLPGAASGQAGAFGVSPDHGVWNSWRQERHRVEPKLRPERSKPVGLSDPDQQTCEALPDPDFTAFRLNGSFESGGGGMGGQEENQSTQAALKDLSGATGRAIHLLSGPRTKIGRHTDGENTAGPGITVKCQWVSRNHAFIERRERSFWITDLGSVNGTYVNSQRISGQHRLGDGDTVRIARYEFEFTCAHSLLRSA